MNSLAFITTDKKFINLHIKTTCVMGKKDIKELGDTSQLFSKLKSYSVDEIVAAGGPTAFAEKMGKNGRTLMDYLKTIPKEDLLTDEEYLSALETLNQSK